MNPETRAAKPRALIVDDDPTARLLLKSGLESAGVEVILAKDGTEGIRLLVDHLLDLDLLVTDLNMPGLDGQALVRIVRVEGGERELAILVVAGTVSQGDRALLARMGVTEVVEKSAGSERIVGTAVRLATESWKRQQGTLLVQPVRTVPIASVAVRPALAG